MNFQLNQFQQEIFNAIHNFNRTASFEYVEWLKQKETATVIVPAVKDVAKVEVSQQRAVPANFASVKVKVRRMRNGRNTSQENETDFLLVKVSELHLARQIDEVTLSYSSVVGGWTTATVSRANGKQMVAPYPTVPQFLKRANIRIKRKHGVAQNQPLNFSEAAY